MLTKMTVEPALNAELDEHLDYKKHSPTNITDDGEIQLEISRDRDASIESKLLRKHHTQFQSMDDKILSLYAKGMTTCEIVATFKEMYDADISAFRFT